MANTARQVISKALKRIGILSEEAAMTAPQAVDGLSSLNDMMHGFNAMGIAYGHTDLTLDSVVNVPDEQVRDVVLLLCAELADPYGKSIGPALQRSIDGALSSLQAFYHVPPTAQLDPGLDNRLVWGGYVTIERM